MTTPELPKLPEGYFWRVTEPSASTGAYKIQIRRKRRVGSALVTYEYEWSTRGVSPMASLERTIRSVYWSFVAQCRRGSQSAEITNHARAIRKEQES